MKQKFLIVFLSAFFLVTNFVVVAGFQQRQSLKSSAAATTSLSFYPPSSFSNPIQAAVGQPLSIDLMMAPGNNKVTKLQVHIVFPKATYSIASTKFVVDKSVFPQEDVAPKVTEGLNGDVNFTVSNPAGIAYETKVGTLTLTPLKAVTEANQNDGVIGFLQVTSATSIQAGDSPTENVIAQLNQAYVHISTDPVPTTVPLSTPVPTFTCLGSCPISPTLPDGGGGGAPLPTDPPAQGDLSPTPCPAGQISSQNMSDFQANHHKKGKNSGGLLQLLIKLIELILQLLGGGGLPAPSDPGSTPSDPGGNPSDPGGTPSDNPCIPEPTKPAAEEPAATDVPEPTAATQPSATTAPVGSAAICGKKTPGAKPGSLPSCTGLTATEPTNNGFYSVTNFGCNTGFPKDSADNCIPSCLDSAPQCQGLSGPACEEKVIWYSANADQYGCNAHVKVTNPTTGKAVILQALDRGPGCAIQRTTGDFDISQAAYKEIDADGVVQVEKVADTTPLGPVPVCTQ